MTSSSLFSFMWLLMIILWSQIIHSFLTQSFFAAAVLTPIGVCFNKNKRHSVKSCLLETLKFKVMCLKKKTALFLYYLFLTAKFECHWVFFKSLEHASSQNKSNVKKKKNPNKPTKETLDLNSSSNNDFRFHDKIMGVITTMTILASVVKMWIRVTWKGI